MTSEQRQTRAGVAYALGGYAIWGITPLYWKLTAWVPAEEMLVPRVLWTALLMLVLLATTRQRTEFLPLLKSGRQIWSSLAAALLLGVNWLIFIYAVQTGRVLATSLGYYINPLVSVLLGMLVLRERLSTLQAVAVVLAIIGIVSLLVTTRALPWISLALAVSFALYGMIHKLFPKPARAGLALEMWLLAPLATAYWLWLASRGEALLGEAPAASHLLIAASALVTAAPLLCFHAATRRLPLVSVGMFQYLSPTLSLLLAVFLYAEPFERAQLAAFGWVWAGLACFAVDALRETRPKSSKRCPRPGGSDNVSRAS